MSDEAQDGDDLGSADDGDDDVPAPGWEAIETAVAAIYPGQEPLHFGTLIKWALGGPDPLDGISVYRHEAPPHWHFVTYGYTELYEKESEDPDESGYGFEMTFRLARDPEGEPEPPRWPLTLLQNLARYVFESGNVFGEGHHLDCNGPISVEHEGSWIRSLAFTEDPELRGERSTPHGAFRFLQAVGLTPDELDACRSWNTAGLLRLLGRDDPLLVTDLARPSLLEQDPEAAARVAAGIAEDGSSQSAAFIESLAWSVDEDGGLELGLGASAVPELCRLLEGRTRFGRPFRLFGPEHAVEVLAVDERPQVTTEERLLRVSLTAALAQRLARELGPRRGTHAWGELPGLSIDVAVSQIRNADGEVVDEIG